MPKYCVKISVYDEQEFEIEAKSASDAEDEAFRLMEDYCAPEYCLESIVRVGD